MIYRQGDILLKPIEKLPKNVNPKYKKNGKKDLVLAEGEVTGHMHQFLDQVNVVCYELLEHQFVDVYQDSELVHEEHKKWTKVNSDGSTELLKDFKIPKGTYEVIQQREVDLLQEIQKVVD